MIYVALLRGINVGGNRKVEMSKLKLTFENLGLSEVKSYINSGNIIFADTKHTAKKLTAMLEAAIEKDFGFPVKVLLRDLPQMEKIARALPTDWTNDTNMKCDVLFLWESSDNPHVLDQLAIKKDIEDVKYVPGAILWRVDRQNVTRSSLIKIVGTPFYQTVTIRNCNTFRKLLELMRGC